MYMGNLQQNNGLYKHGANGSPQLWGRGNGWGAAASAELLRIIPEDHEKYDTFIDHYKKHMQGLVDAQWESGMWPQLLLSDDNRNWEETSGTSMFVFALFTGLELKILDEETFLEPAKKGWMAVKEYLSSDGRLQNVAEGFWPRANDANEYLTAAKAAPGNSHGTAGFLWAATSVVRYYTTKTETTQFYIHQPNQYTHSDMQLKKDHFFDLKGRIIPAAAFRKNIGLPTSGALLRTNASTTTKLVTVQ
jgi:rhamnogalacturonyl hydrolase YesR